MDAVAPTIFLLARLLLMTDDGTQLISEHRARVPAGGTGLVMETLSLEGFPGALHIYLSPVRIAPPAGPEDGSGDGEPSGWLRVVVGASLWESPEQAASGRPPRETNTESVEIAPAGSRLVQLAEDAPRGRRLFLSLSSPPPPDPGRPPPPGLQPAPGRISFRVEVFQGTSGARELLESHLLMTVERSPVSWDSRWKRPIPREDGRGIAYRDEGITLKLLPVVTDSGWVSVEAELSAVLYPEGGTEPLTLSSRATRTLPLGIPFEVELKLPEEEKEKLSIIVEITPFRPGG